MILGGGGGGGGMCVCVCVDHIFHPHKSTNLLSGYRAQLLFYDMTKNL